MSGIIKSEIKAKQDEHVFIIIETPDRPTISLDVQDSHGRRVLSVRLNGIGVSNLLVDMQELPPMEKSSQKGAWVRFCPYCGERFSIFSSKSHNCKDEIIDTEVRGEAGELEFDSKSHHGHLKSLPPYVGGDDDEIEAWQAECCGCKWRGHETKYQSVAYDELVAHLNSVLMVESSGMVLESGYASLRTLLDAIDRGRALLPNANGLLLEVENRVGDGLLWRSDASMLLDEDDLAALRSLLN